MRPPLRPRGLEICPDCHDLRGGPVAEWIGPDTFQLCECATAEERAAQPRWAPSDFNKWAELCRACGMVLVRSGSRYGEFFCDPCRDKAHRVNEVVGRYVIPRGRHSVMNRIVVPAVDPRPAEIQALVNTVHAIGRGMALLTEYRNDLVGDLVRALGFPPGTAVPVADYLAALETADFSADVAFDGMVAYLIPNYATIARHPAG